MRRRRALRLVAGGALVLVLLGSALGMMAAEPSSGAAGASPGTVVGGPVDPRSEGEGPGLDASPLAIAVGVVVLGALAAGATALWVRLTRED